MNKKDFLYVLVLLLFTGCAKFGLDNFSLSSSQFVNINGVTSGPGGTDITQDVYLFEGNIATIHWVDEPDEDSYDVTLFANDGITIVCALTNVPQNSTTHTFLGCPLVEGRAYWALVEAVRIETVGGSSAKVTSQSVIGNGGFNFLYPPFLALQNLSVPEGIGTANVVAILSSPSDWPLSFDWSTSDGTALNSGIFKDYDLRSVTNVVIPAGTLSVNLGVTITDDPRDEDPQIFSVTYSNEVAAKVNPGDGRSMALTIIDNDPPPDLSFTNQTITEGDSTSVITMSLSMISEKVITFSYVTGGGTASAASDYMSIPATPVMFNPGDNDVSFSIQSSDDVDVCEFDETVGIQIIGDTNLGAAPTDLVSIEDNDYPRLTLEGDSQVEGSPLTFRATLSDPCPTETVTFDWHTIDINTKSNEDYPVQTGTVSFVPNDVLETFMVITTDDTIRDADREFISIGAQNRQFLSDSGAAATGTIIDNEVGEVTSKIKTAGNTTCALSTAGQVKCWGMNAYIGYDGGHYGDQPGEMGDSLPVVDLGTWDHDNDPGSPDVSLQAQKISGNSGASCALLNNNKIKCWGSAYYAGNSGQTYGDDLNEMGNNLPFINLGTVDALGVTQHTAKDLIGNSITFCALLNDDRVKCWGQNYNGQTGVPPTGNLGRVGDGGGEMGDDLSYVDFGTHDGLGVTPHTVKELSMPCVILDTDQVKCWGQNSWGNLGTGDTGHRGNQVGQMGDNLPYVDLGTGRTALKISASCAILDNNGLKCWGLSFINGSETIDNLGDDPNEMGDNLPYVDLGTIDGLGVTQHTAKSVSVGRIHVCAVLDDDRIKCWGRGTYGRRGSGNTAEAGRNPNSMGDSLPYVDLGTGYTAKKISVQNQTTYVLRNDDSLISFGRNNYGALGLGHNSSIGDQSGEMGDNLVPVSLGAGRYVVSLNDPNGDYGSESGGTRGESTCAILDNGEVKCWGFMGLDSGIGDITARYKIGDSPAELGGALQSIQLPSGTYALDLFSGYGYSGHHVNYCATLNNGNFVCWGTSDAVPNFGGSNPNTADRPNYMGDNLDQHTLPGGLSAIKVYPHRRGSCALSSDLDLYCWGGQHGLISLILMNGGVTSGFNPSAGTKVLVGTNRKVLDFNRGYGHLCVLLDNYQLKCWGGNSYGQLGLGDTSSRGSDASTSGDNLAYVDLGSISYPVEFAASRYSTCARFNNNRVKCFGRGSYGSLGSGNISNIGDNLNEMGDNLPFIDLGGDVDQLYAGKSSNHFCARRLNGELICWGSGPLGNGSTSSIGDGANEMGSNLIPVDLDGGVVRDYNNYGYHACVVQTNHEIKCWGNNKYGQLGQGNLNSIGYSSNEMGVNLSPINIVW